MVNQRPPRPDLRRANKKAGRAPVVAVVMAVLACLVLAAAGIFFSDSLRGGANANAASMTQRSNDWQQRTQRLSEEPTRDLDANAELANW